MSLCQMVWYEKALRWAFGGQNGSERVPGAANEKQSLV